MTTVRGRWAARTSVVPCQPSRTHSEEFAQSQALCLRNCEPAGRLSREGRGAAGLCMRVGAEIIKTS